MATRESSSPGEEWPPPHLTLRGTDFELVSVRRSGVAVYRGDATYLRIGAGLEPELAVHRLMLDHGYRVPRIMEAGRHDGAPYAIEESLGSRTLGDRFEREQESDGRISDEGFSVFADVAERFARAQAACAGAAGKRGDILVALVHPDLHAFNMCSGGVIDLEGADWGPAGYDVATAPFVPALCGLTSSRTPWFTPAQISEHLARVDLVFHDRGLPLPTERLDELLVRRALSLCVKGHPDPALRRARTRVLRVVIDTFLSGGGVSALLQQGG